MMNTQPNRRIPSPNPVHRPAVPGGGGARVALIAALVWLGWPATGLLAAEPAAGASPGSGEEEAKDQSTSSREVSNEISASGDFLLGFGDVTVPLFFSLGEAPSINDPSLKQVANPDRDSRFYGATISYSAGQAWYFDLNYVQGSSEGSVAFGFIDDARFSLDENYLQASVRYAFPRYRGTRFSLYVRAGVGYNDGEMQVQGSTGLGPYEQNNQTKDLFGTAGAGVGYILYTSKFGSFRIALQAEAEGFYGNRSQETSEKIDTGNPSDLGFVGPEVSFDNTLYGVIGRGTVRFQVRLNESGRARAYLDSGIQSKYTQIDYNDLGSFSELLWGPYVRAGFRYSF